MSNQQYDWKNFAGVVVCFLLLAFMTGNAFGVVSATLRERTRFQNELVERGLGRWKTNSEFEWIEKQ